VTIHVGGGPSGPSKPSKALIRDRQRIALATAKLVLEANAGRKRRDPNTPACYVRWSDLDALADALRGAGVVLDAPNLGAVYRAAMDDRARAHAAKRAEEFAERMAELEEERTKGIPIERILATEEGEA
jgi:hypothetical protein